MKFRRQFKKDYQGRLTPEINNEPSMTVPDMSLTVKELLRNHVKGIHSNVKNYDPQFFDTEIPRFDDMVEEMEYKEELANKIKNYEKQQKEKKKNSDLLNKQPGSNQDPNDVSMGHPMVEPGIPKTPQNEKGVESST